MTSKPVSEQILPLHMLYIESNMSGHSKTSMHQKCQFLFARMEFQLQNKQSEEAYQVQTKKMYTVCGLLWLIVV